MVASFDDLESASGDVPEEKAEGYTEDKVLKKGQQVTYNGVKSEISAINDNGTVDVQELESPGKDVNGAEIAPRWHHQIDPAGVEV